MDDRHNPSAATEERFGPATRAVRAGLPLAQQGEPLLPGPTFAAPFHLRGPIEDAGHVYGRGTNPTWARYEEALGALEGGEAVCFASGMAAVTAVLLELRPGEVLVVPADGYPGVRELAREHLTPRGVDVRVVPTDEHAVREALAGATLVWVESPSNPRLDLLDLAALADDVHAAGARLAVDNTLATPLLQRPLELGADLSVSSDSKHLSGHSDLVLGHVACTDPGWAAALRTWRTRTGSIPGPFEVWLAHRSLATLGVRLERGSASAGALADLLLERPEVLRVHYPGMGTVLSFELADEPTAEAFLDGCALVAQATSFGGVHSSAERRARWGPADAVGGGFIRFSAGVEDTEDLLADVVGALDALGG
ncbi:MAG: cystathionine gamma-lyase [Solirubrobacterales bacterium]|nr:cystathionine gamma-lyase [Solirubrobacterales bacterium]